MKTLTLWSQKRVSGSWYRRACACFIKAWTRGIYSHSELQFPNGKSFSSRKDGVSFRLIDYNDASGLWDALGFQVSDDEYDHICVRATEICGEGYDWWGLALDQVFRTHLHRDCDWWCSEAIAHALGFYPELLNPTELAARVYHQFLYRE
jgi:hypothetical protein